MNSQNKIDYDTLTEEQLEEWIEFIDWMLIPRHLITPKIRQLFDSIPELIARLWAESFLDYFYKTLFSLEISKRKEYMKNINHIETLFYRRFKFVHPDFLEKVVNKRPEFNKHFGTN